jgi:hypothetical protein
MTCSPAMSCPRANTSGPISAEVNDLVITDVYRKSHRKWVIVQEHISEPHTPPGGEHQTSPARSRNFYEVHFSSGDAHGIDSKDNRNY